MQHELPESLSQPNLLTKVGGEDRPQIRTLNFISDEKPRVKDKKLIHQAVLQLRITKAFGQVRHRLKEIIIGLRRRHQDFIFQFVHNWPLNKSQNIWGKQQEKRVVFCNIALEQSRRGQQRRKIRQKNPTDRLGLLQPTQRGRINETPQGNKFILTDRNFPILSLTNKTCSKSWTRN